MLPPLCSDTCPKSVGGPTDLHVAPLRLQRSFSHLTAPLHVPLSASLGTRCLPDAATRAPSQLEAQLTYLPLKVLAELSPLIAFTFARFMKSSSVLLTLLLSLTTHALPALQVDPTTGNDANDGVTAPVKTIARAVKLAQPGDTIYLTPHTYYESVVLSGKQGLPGKPITLDGQGAIIEGSEPVIAANWEALGGDLYRKTQLVPNMNSAILGRWFFLWNGQMNHMGRSSKGLHAPLKKVEELQPKEWTYVESEDAFYLKLPEGQNLDAARIRYPLRSSGVVLSGKGGHFVVRNITSTHVHNDGFNIHGDQRDTVFENITSIECGDDGFSAHETAECHINGFTSIGNSTGMCDIGSSETHYKNVFISGCTGHEIFFIGDAPHSLENVLVESSAHSVFTVSQGAYGDPNKPCQVTAKNVFISRPPNLPGEVRVNQNCILEATNCTFNGLNITIVPSGSLNLTNSFVTGTDPKPNVVIFAQATWKGQSNHYDVKSLRVDQTFFAPETFTDFQTLTASELHSQWASNVPPAQGIGADESELEKLRH